MLEEVEIEPTDRSLEQQKFPYTEKRKIHQSTCYRTDAEVCESCHLYFGTIGQKQILIIENSFFFNISLEDHTFEPFRNIFAVLIEISPKHAF